MTGSTAALAYPPHVTLRTGALVPERNVAEFAAGMAQTLGKWRAFPVRTDGLFSTTYQAQDGTPRYIVGWRVVPDACLAGLHRRLLSYERFMRRAQPAFEPHVTLAFEDLAEEQVDPLLRHATDRPRVYPPRLEWPCTSVGLYWLRDGGWECAYRFLAEEVQ